MAGAAQITLVGNLVADPESRNVGGATVVNLTIAVSERQFDKDTNEWVEKGTSFYRCNAWRDLAEHVAGSLSKGDRVVAQGTLRQRSYDKDGESKQVWEVELDEIAPSLKYATAVVTRTSGGNRNQRGHVEQQRNQSPARPPQQRAEQQSWPTATTYADDQPF